MVLLYIILYIIYIKNHLKHITIYAYVERGKMKITKDEAEEYRAVLNIKVGLKNRPAALARLGLLSDRTAKKIRKVEDYITSIDDPIQRYAMRARLITGCSPDIAAAAAVKHFRKQDPTGSTKRMVTELITAELKSME